MLSVGVTSWMLTGVLRRYALAKNLLDIPNDRSSHIVPTPRGGGVAIVLTFLVSLLLLAGIELLELSDLIGLFGAGVLVALIGFVDDHRHIPARWRLVAHFTAAGWTVAWLGGLPPLPVFGFMLDLGWLGYGLAAVYLVWLLNLYNFMDGIDGIAGIEAVTVCLGGAALYTLSPAGDSEWLLPILLLAAVIGFLFWNFPIAKIFMGDVGSGFIGIMIGGLSIQAAWVAPGLFWGWIILLGVFIVDATVTLYRRVRRGEKFYEAHRSHAYQWSSRRWGHSRVTIAVMFINIFWLFPLAYYALVNTLFGALITLIAFVPLVLLALVLGAGRQEVL